MKRIITIHLNTEEINNALRYHYCGCNDNDAEVLLRLKEHLDGDYCVVGATLTYEEKE